MGAKRGGIMVVLVAIYTRGTNSDRPRLGTEPPELVSISTVQTPDGKRGLPSEG